MSGVSRRPGNQLLAELTDDKNKAQDFGTAGYADSVINRLVNPFNRVFKPVLIKVTQPEKAENYSDDDIN